MIRIVHRYNSTRVLYEGEHETVREALIAAAKALADLTDANLTGADLTGADLRGAYLRGAYLRGADLTGADLRGADLRGADLTGAYLRGADLRGAYLWGADLRGAYLTGADLTDADLTGADLTGAYLTGADLRGADLRGAYLWGADLTGAYLRGAEIAAGGIADILGSGSLLRYRWTAYRMSDATVRLRVGCEERPLPEWDEHLPGICRQHEPNDAALYEAAYRPLLVYVAAIADAIPAPEVVRGGAA